MEKLSLHPSQKDSASITKEEYHNLIREAYAVSEFDPDLLAGIFVAFIRGFFSYDRGCTENADHIKTRPDKA
jgi:hypothetical protein